MQFKLQLRKRYEQGLTLIEASMVLALSAVVVAGVSCITSRRRRATGL